MTDHEPAVIDVLDQLVPTSAAPSDWQRVLRDAERHRRPRLTAVIGVAAIVLLLASGALLWPFGGQQQGGVLERALAAVGDGSTVHVVFRGDTSVTLVDVETGDRRQAFVEREVWYDRARGLHEIWRVDDQIVQESLWPPAETPDVWQTTFAGVADGYRDSLAAGTAKLVGTGEVDGVPVHWVRLDERSLPADGRDWAFDVAVSQQTFLPVATRITGNGAPTTPPMLSRIVLAELVNPERARFERLLRGRQLRDAACCRPVGAVPLDRVAAVLGAEPVWAGTRFNGLSQNGASLTEGSIRWEGEDDARPVPFVRLFYGELEAGGAPDFGKPYLLLELSTRLLPPLFGVTGYSPPPGTAVLTESGVLVRAGQVFVHIRASGTPEEMARPLEERRTAPGTETALRAARVLEPIPARPTG